MTSKFATIVAVFLALPAVAAEPQPEHIGKPDQYANELIETSFACEKEADARKLTTRVCYRFKELSVAYLRARAEQGRECARQLNASAAALDAGEPAAAVDGRCFVLQSDLDADLPYQRIRQVGSKIGLPIP